MRSSYRPAAGQLHLLLGVSGARTVVKDCYCRAPLQVLRPVYADDTGMASIYLLNPCGAMLGGDTYSISMCLEAGAQAYVTTPAATQIYTAPGAATRQCIDLTLHDGAVLGYFPEQTIPFAGSALHQEITVRLGAGAAIFVGDIVAPGRLARRECFAYRSYCASLRIEDWQGEVLLLDRTRLRPQEQHLTGLGMFEGLPYLGTFYALRAGQRLPAALAERLHTLLAARQGLQASASELEDGGVVVRMLATNHGTVRQAMDDVWDTVRRCLFGVPAASRRR